MEYNTKLYFDGEKARIQNKKALEEWLKQFGNDVWMNVTITPIGNIDTDAQSKLYFKWRDIIAQELGWTKKDMHTYLKETFNGSNSTKGMDTKQWSEFMTQVLAFAGENNITLPTGNEHENN